MWKALHSASLVEIDEINHASPLCITDEAMMK